jgi:predicted Zn-dependent protease
MQRFVLALGTVGGLALTPLLPTRAFACVHAMPETFERQERLVSEAEEALRKGRHDTAAAKVQQAYPGLALREMSSNDTPGRDPLTEDGPRARALQVLSVATVRADGKLVLEGRKTSTVKAQGEMVEWAVSNLRVLSAQHSDNTGLKSRLAEGLSKRPAGRAEARTILEDLARADLMVDAEGWATLADLRQGAGDPVGRDKAVAECLKRAKNRQMCTAFGVEGPHT